MKLFNRKDLRPDELVMLETAEAQAATPSRYVRELLRRLHESRAAKDDSASRVEFKVGDYVEVVRGIHKHRFGKVMEVNYGGTAYVRMDGCTLNVAVEQADLVKAPKFKIGDIVAINEAGKQFYSKLSGWGKIEENDGTGWLRVSFRASEGGCVHYVHENALKLGWVGAAEATLKFKVGDRVVVAGSGSIGTVVFMGPVGVDVALDFSKRTTCFAENALERCAEPKFKINDRVRVLAGAYKDKLGIVRCVGDGWTEVYYALDDSLRFATDNLVLAPKALPLETTAYLCSVDYDSSIGGHAACTPTVNAKFDLLGSIETGSVGGELKLCLPKEKYGDYVGKLGKLFTLKLEEAPQPTPPMEPLLCPFCGGKPHVSGPGAASVSYNVRCLGCSAGYTRDSHAEALAAWNRRVR